MTASDENLTDGIRVLTVRFMKATLREIAFHEAGHAVVGRYLGYGLGQIWIEPDTGQGGAEVYSASRHGALILAASTACLNAFGIVITLSFVALDECKLQTILSQNPPSTVDEDDDQWLEQRIQDVRKEVAAIFQLDNVRAAVLALAPRLVAERRISGAEAEALIDNFLSPAS